MMLINYDSKVRTLHLRFKYGYTKFTRNVSDRVIIRYGGDDEPKSILILHAPDMDTGAISTYFVPKGAELKGLYNQILDIPESSYGSPSRSISISLSEEESVRINELKDLNQAGYSFNEFVRDVVRRKFEAQHVSFPSDREINTIQMKTRIPSGSVISESLGIWYFEKLDEIYIKTSYQHTEYISLPSHSVEVDLSGEQQVTGVQVRNVKRYFDSYVGFSFGNGRIASRNLRDRPPRDKQADSLAVRRVFRLSQRQVQAILDNFEGDEIEFIISNMIKNYLSNLD